MTRLRTLLVLAALASVALINTVVPMLSIQW